MNEYIIKRHAPLGVCLLIHNTVKAVIPIIGYGISKVVVLAFNFAQPMSEIGKSVKIFDTFELFFGFFAKKTFFLLLPRCFITNFVDMMKSSRCLCSRLELH